MTPLPGDATDVELLAYVDRWVALLEAEDYQAVFDFTDHDPTMGWTPALIREVINRYGEASPSQRVTVKGSPSDVVQRKGGDPLVGVPQESGSSGTT